MRDGFTLLEVMIALAIAAIALTAGLGIIAQSHQNTAHLVAKIAADTAARNLMDRHRMALPENKRTQIIAENGEVEMAGHTFSYRQNIAQAGLPELKKVTIDVHDNNHNTVLRSLSMYVARKGE